LLDLYEGDDTAPMPN